MTGTDDLVEDAVAVLYSAPIDDFTALRTQRAKAAKAGGDPEAAKAITALRKPTVAAAVVNRYVWHDPAASARLAEIGDRLRRAHRDLDATVLRGLSGERRTLVAELTTAALAHDGREDATSAQRDEVAGSFDAAVADPDVAARLGRLLRPERFSGFGPAAGAALTLVHGDEPSRTISSTTPTKPARTKPTSSRLSRAATKARAALDDAEQQLALADVEEQRAQQQVRALTDQLSAVQRELDDAKQQFERARRQTRAARGKHRVARSALDRAERKLSE